MPKRIISNAAYKLTHSYYSCLSSIKQFSPNVLWILGHSRSGSTLVSHILCSNPQICGYGETYTTYRSEHDFNQLRTQIHFHLRDFGFSEKYIFDKILHDDFLPNSEIILSSRVKIVFLLREPVGTLNSIVNIDPEYDYERALGYYKSRLITLVEYGKILSAKKDYCLLTYGQILNSTDIVLSQLQSFLGLNQALSSEYKRTRMTGKKASGDFSEKIKLGYISRSNQLQTVAIPQSILEEATYYFNYCYSSLENLSESLDFENK